jgi:TolA-binding protein
MTTVVWLVIAGCVGGIAYLAWRALDKARERERTEEARFAAFIQAGKPTTAPVAPPPALASAPPAASNPQEKALFEAANKATEAGEPQLALQLYQRLVERFPAGEFAPGARMAIDLHRSRRAKG